MILGFKQFFPWHTEKNPAPTYFREKILANWGKEQAEKIVKKTGDVTTCLFYHEGTFTPKLHTIREGNRWKAGNIMHMAYGVRTKNYQQFNKGIGDLEFVNSVQPISIKYLNGYLLPVVAIDGKILDDSDVDRLAINDGFEDINEFFNWFDKDFQGQIIHWTDLRY